MLFSFTSYSTVNITTKSYSHAVENGKRIGLYLTELRYVLSDQNWHKIIHPCVQIHDADP